VAHFRSIDLGWAHVIEAPKIANKNTDTTTNNNCIFLISLTLLSIEKFVAVQFFERHLDPISFFSSFSWKRES
jgi:hypothetical protein